MPESPMQIPTSTGDLFKLFMQQFGNLTFGLISVFLMYQFMFKPQMEISNETSKSQREILEIMHRLAESLQRSALHMERTVEMQDRAMLKEPGK